MFVLLLTLFVLAVFLGFEIITKVPPTLHTPLMSGANAISGIAVVGALIVAGHNPGFGAGADGGGGGGSLVAGLLGGLAVMFAMINVAGGFGVTHRMLAMFRKKG